MKVYNLYQIEYFDKGLSTMDVGNLPNYLNIIYSSSFFYCFVFFYACMFEFVDV